MVGGKGGLEAVFSVARLGGQEGGEWTVCFSLQITKSGLSDI